VVGVGLTLNFPSNPFWVDEWYLPYIIPTSLIRPQSKNILHQANIDIYSQTNELCNLEMIRMWGKKSKWEVVMFVVLGAHVRVLTLISSCHLNAKFAWTSIDVYFVKGDFYFIFLMLMQKMAFVLPLTFRLKIWHSLVFRKFFAYMMPRNMGQFAHSKCKVASLL
jgi:hypothetical protein